jgi:hypothetical protein
MPTTTRWALPYPALTDPADGPDGFQKLAAALDDVAKDDQGPIASRPSSSPSTPGKKGRYYWAMDQAILYRDNGIGWDVITLSAPVDPAPEVPGLRTLGTGAQQAAAGTDPRLSDQRIPIDNSVTYPKVHVSLKPTSGASAAQEALRALGVQPGMAAQGLHHTQHDPQGADPIDYTKVIMQGTLNQRPAPANWNNGLLFYTTDGKLLYRSDGVNWVVVGSPSSGIPLYLTVANFPPSNPTDAMEVYLLVSASAPFILWHLRYNATANSQYKWEVVGSGTGVMKTGGIVNDLAETAVPAASVAVPRPGEYRSKFGATFTATLADGQTVHLSCSGGFGGTIVPNASFQDSLVGVNPNFSFEYKTTVAGNVDSFSTNSSVNCFVRKQAGPLTIDCNNAWVEAIPLRIQ